MSAKTHLLLFLTFFLTSGQALFEHNKKTPEKPNILFIIADDLGWNDLEWHDPNMKTPFLKEFAFDRHTVYLNQTYVNQECTPTRSSFFTGVYPHHVGVQDGVFLVQEPAGVPTWFRMLPQDLKLLGYDNYLLGKWHLGYCNESFLPTSRGFDEHFGIYQAMTDHFTHFSGPVTYPMKNLTLGLDFWHQNLPKWEYSGQYSTEIYIKKAREILKNHDKSKPFFFYYGFQAIHMPLQVPEKYMKECRQKQKNRRIFCGMTYAVDLAIKDIVNYLKELDLYDNTIIVFTSDNGGAVDYGGNNWPLRGSKFTLWEGGTRTHGLIHSSKLVSKFAVRNGIFHVTDWYATLLAAAGESIYKYGDGYNQWDMIIKGSKSPRKSLVYNYAQPEIGIDPFGGGNGGAIRVGKHKLVLGRPGMFNEWYEPDKWKGHLSFVKLLKTKVWLFDLEADPTERNNLADEKPILTEMLRALLDEIGKSAVPSVHKDAIDEGHPRHFNNTIASGFCNLVD